MFKIIIFVLGISFLSFAHAGLKVVPKNCDSFKSDYDSAKETYKNERKNIRSDYRNCKRSCTGDRAAQRSCRQNCKREHKNNKATLDELKQEFKDAKKIYRTCKKERRSIDKCDKKNKKLKDKYGEELVSRKIFYVEDGRCKRNKDLYRNLKKTIKETRICGRLEKIKNKTDSQVLKQAIAKKVQQKSCSKSDFRKFKVCYKIAKIKSKLKDSKDTALLAEMDRALSSGECSSELFKKIKDQSKDALKESRCLSKGKEWIKVTSRRGKTQYKCLNKVRAFKKTNKGSLSRREMRKCVRALKNCSRSTPNETDVNRARACMAQKGCPLYVGQ
ncbi:MAG: hypothetical protein ACOCUH_03415 [Bacteriovoracia bacterium]